MRCTRCNEELEEGFLYCKKCGQEIRIVPDYNPLVEEALSGTLQDVFSKEKTDKSKSREEQDEVMEEQSEEYSGSLGKKIGLVFIILFLIAVSIGGFLLFRVKKDSYEYQYQKALECYEDKSIDKSLEHINRAIELTGDHSECYKLRAQILLDLGDKTGAVNDYKYIIEKLEPNNQEIYIKLINLYIELDEMSTVKELLSKCTNTAVLRYFKEYIGVIPKASFPDGVYYDSMEIQLEADGRKIYFTLDGSKPTLESSVYEGSIQLVEGITTIRAISVSSEGIISDEAIFNYEISYLEPELPTISPVSGNYGNELEIVIHVPDGCTVLYTLDGTTPTLSSNVYTKPIIVHESVILKVISVSMSEKISEVITRNYTLNTTE